MIDEELREKLAAHAHEAWSGWMRYMLDNGGVMCPSAFDTHLWVMYPEKHARWTRQMRTPYAELPEEEKESDRAEAHKLMAIFDEWLTKRGEL